MDRIVRGAISTLSKAVQTFASPAKKSNDGNRSVKSEQPGHIHFDPNASITTDKVPTFLGTREMAPLEAWESLKAQARNA